MPLSPQSLAAATKAIESHQRLLILPHANVDPDALGSALACALLFQAMGKEVTVVCSDGAPESLKFLPGASIVRQDVSDTQNFVVTIDLEPGVEVDKLRYSVEDRRVHIIVVPKHGHIHSNQVSFSEGERPFDLIVAVDTADLVLYGPLYRAHPELFEQIPILNVDHHISNTQYGQMQLIDPTAASATEVLYQWFTQTPQFRDKITPDICTLLLTGLITDTRSFQNPNTTPRSLEVAADLLERGARQQEIVQQIYKTKPLSTLKIWGRALNRIQIDKDARIVWSIIGKDDLAELGATSKETHGILDELISTIPDADVYVLFTEKEEGGLKASMRSSPAIDVSALAAKAYGGGGHPRAAGFSVASFPNFQLQVLECVQKLKDGMREMGSAAKGIDVPQIAPVQPKQIPVTAIPRVDAPRPVAVTQPSHRDLPAPSSVPQSATPPVQAQPRRPQPPRPPRATSRPQPQRPQQPPVRSPQNVPAPVASPPPTASTDVVASLGHDKTGGSGADVVSALKGQE